MDVGQYMWQELHLRGRDRAADLGLADFPLDSHCGKECKKIIDGIKIAARTLGYMPSETKDWVRTAVEVICFG